MQYHYFLFSLLAIIIPILTLAQNDTAYIRQTSSYVETVDTLDAQTQDQPNQGHPRLMESIAEGPITMTTTQITFNKAKGKNDTTLIKQELGGFSIHTLSSFNDDTLFMVSSHDNSTKNLYESYYYRNDTLLCSKISLEDDGIGKVLYQRVEYYKAGKVCYAITPIDSLTKDLRYRVSFSWLEKGHEYLRKFKAR